ncbi:MAG: large conductance mechanosensitive channel protein MscL [Candidatus Limnocylindrales bacterium]
MWNDFKAFLLKTNTLALALGVIIGVALGAVVNSLVKDILMPPIGLLLGGVDFENLYVSLNGKSYPSLKAAHDAGAATINYGIFINTVIVFIVVAFVVFLIGRKLLEPAAPSPDTKPCPRCGETVLRVATRCPRCTSEGI